MRRGSQIWFMPSPIGHAMAGVAVAWFAEAVSPVLSRTSRGPDDRLRVANPPWRGWLPAASGVIATLPDLDILFNAHRSATHSLGAVVVVTIVVALSCAVWLKLPILRTAVICGLAYTSHAALDWLGKDSSNPAGLMALWPLTQTYFVSGLDLFLEISRRYWRFDEFVVGNLRSLSRELAILGPLTVMAWWAGPRRSSRSGHLPVS